MVASAPAGEAPAADAIPLRILYEDDYLLVVDKPAGMVTHPAPGHSSGTLVNALLAHAPELADVGDRARPGIVHRLDKDTSGLLVVAKDPATHAALAQQMKDRAMVKRYLALVEGAMPTAEGVIDAPIGRDPRQRLRMGLLSVASGGREARTRFRMLEEHGGRSLLEVQLETGRTHQIRVHLAAVHHPVVGDPVYGRAQRPLPPRQFLHAAHLEFRHPATGEWLTFDAPLPDDLASFLATWRAEPVGRQGHFLAAWRADRCVFNLRLKPYVHAQPHLICQSQACWRLKPPWGLRPRCPPAWTSPPPPRL